MNQNPTPPPPIPFRQFHPSLYFSPLPFLIRLCFHQHTNTQYLPFFTNNTVTKNTHIPPDFISQRQKSPNKEHFHPLPYPITIPLYPFFISQTNKTTQNAHSLSHNPCTPNQLISLFHTNFYTVPPPLSSHKPTHTFTKLSRMITILINLIPSHLIQPPHPEPQHSLARILQPPPPHTTYPFLPLPIDIYTTNIKSKKHTIPSKF